jgi:potassium-transporting ATPase KdpC subunit
MRAQIRPALAALLSLTLLTGFIYPLLVTGLAQVIFPKQANGSLMVRNQQVLGSELIGQQFDDPGYFWGRPSATTPYPYNASASSGSNLGPTNPVLIDVIQQRVAEIKASDPANTLPIPIDLITASASGLDPHISPAAAQFQVPRVAKQRGMSETELNNLVKLFTEDAQWKIFGEPRVNVLKLNLALDGIK